MNETFLIVFLAVHTVLIVMLAGLLLLTVRQVGILSLRLGPVGSRMTAAGPEIESDQSSNDVIREIASKSANGRKILVALVSPECTGCRILYPALKTIGNEEIDTFIVVAAVARSLTDDERRKLQKEVGSNVFIVASEKLFQEWAVTGTPYCVVLDEKLKVKGKGVTNTIEHLDSLINTTSMQVASIDEYLWKHNASRLNSSEEERDSSGQTLTSLKSL